VALTIENSQRELDFDSDEVTISRKLYRDGESEYRINDTSVRLKDVRELLMDTGLGKDGYCSIGQGKVADIVSAKSDERREIFEEASGISKFRYRKSESEKKLSLTEENLVRLRDILGELEDRVEPLKKQSEKAKEFLKLSERKSQLEISLWTNKIEKIKVELDEVQKNTIIARNEYGEAQAILCDIEKSIQRIFEQMQALMQEIDQKRNENSALEEEISNKNAKVAVLYNDIEHNKQATQEIQKSIEEKSFGTEEFREKIDEQNQLVCEQNKIIESLSEKKSQKDNEIHELLEKKEQAQQQLISLQNKKMAFDEEVSKIIISKASSDAIIGEASSRLDEIKASRENGEINTKNIIKEIEQCRELIASSENEIKGLYNSRSGYELKKQSVQKQLLEIESFKGSLTDKISTLTQRRNILVDMERNLEGFNHSVKYILKQKQLGILKGIHTTVAGIISTEEKYSVAIEIALSASAQNIVVDDEISARNAISALKNSGQGRATFLPLTAIKGREFYENGVRSESGFVGIASELVKYDNIYQQIIQNIFGKTVIVTDIDKGIDIAKKFKNSFKIVTLDGQIINAGGSMTGGSISKKTGILTRQSQIVSLEKEISDYNQKLEEKIPILEETSNRLKLICGQIDALSSAIKSGEDELIGFKSELSVLENSLVNAKEQYKKQEIEYENAKKKIGQLSEKNVTDTETILKLQEQSQTLQLHIDEIQKSNADFLEKINGLKAKNSSYEIQLLGSKKDLENMLLKVSHYENRFKEGEEEKEKQKLKIENYIAENACLEEQIQALKQEITQIKQRIVENNHNIEQSIESRTDLEGETTQLRQKEKVKSALRENVAGEIARLEEKSFSIQSAYDTIIAKLWDEYGMTRTEAISVAIPCENRAEFEKELVVIKGKIKSLGTVNVSAIEEYREISKRYEFMLSQVSDVEKSKKELQKIISDLTVNMKKMFEENFYSIAKSFSRIFTELFGGGKASLSLDDPDNFLESGIIIKV
ncbi:MAG: chromosome segregation protein SMC, partial [Oscillospiraceae bacterium]